MREIAHTFSLRNWRNASGILFHGILSDISYKNLNVVLDTKRSCCHLDSMNAFFIYKGFLQSLKGAFTAKIRNYTFASGFILLCSYFAFPKARAALTEPI